MDVLGSRLEGGLCKVAFVRGRRCSGSCQPAAPAWPLCGTALAARAPQPPRPAERAAPRLRNYPLAKPLALSQLPQSHVLQFHFIKEPSLFAVAKLLETGLVNMRRIEILWRPLTGHLLEVTNGFHHLY